MLESVPPARRRLLVGGAAALALAVVVALVLALTGGDTAEVDQADPGPVVLVPGYGGGPDSVEALRQVLASAGRDVAVVDTPGDGTGDIREQAEVLADVVDDARERTGASSVDVVGYSAGGVVARWYVRELGGDAVVRRVLTLGSPHHGTDNVATALQAAGSCSEACEQLAPDSDLLRRLNAGDETPSGPLWATLRTTEDTVVVPVDSAELDGALNVLVQDVCPGATTSHGELPLAPATRAMLTATLGVAEPTVPTACPR